MRFSSLSIYRLRPQYQKEEAFKAGDGNKINSITSAIFSFTDIEWKHKRKIHFPRNNVRIGHSYVCHHSCNPKYWIVSARPRCKRRVVEGAFRIKNEKLCHLIVILLVEMFGSDSLWVYTALIIAADDWNHGFFFTAFYLAIDFKLIIFLLWKRRNIYLSF